VSVQERKERVRGERRQLIVKAARELAETEGWDAVTTRRLADRIEYSQPVLYSHFPGGKDEIRNAVALEGFAELAVTVRVKIGAELVGKDSVERLADVYVTFAQRNPALYDAMFAMTTDLPFAAPDTPKPMQDAFAALMFAVHPVTGKRDPGLFTEVCWAALHGVVTLTRTGRLPAHAHRARIRMLVDALS
jgi:AcrR family transcriptional regulator